MRNGKKSFYLIGLPAITVFILFSIIHFMVTFLAIAICGLVLYFAIMNGKWKRQPYIRATKFSLIMLLISVGSFVFMFAPHAWLGQFAVNLDKSKLIEPNNEKILSLKTEFEDWLENDEPYLTSYSGTVISYDNSSNLPFQYEDYTRYYYTINYSEVEFSELSFPQQMFTIDHFIQDIIMDYEYDEDTYGSMEYKATVDEILAEGYASGWTIKSEDDCDGSAVVCVSFLQSLGYDAYIGSGKNHWFSVVEPREEDDFDRTVFLNTWKSVHVFYYFNQNELKLGQPLIDTIKDTWLIDDDLTDVDPIIEFIEGRLYLVFLVSLVLSLVVVLIICFPRQRSDKLRELLDEKRTNRLKRLESIKFIGDKRNPLYWLFRGFYVRVGNPFHKLYLNYWIDISWVTFSLSLILLGAINWIEKYWLFTYLAIALWAVLFVLDGNYIPKLKNYVASSIKKRDMASIENKNVIKSGQ